MMRIIRFWRGLPWAAKLAALMVVLFVLLLMWRATRPAGPQPGRIMNVTPYNQGDYTQTVAVINGEKKTVKSSGCGAVCVAVVGEYLTGSAEHDPQSLFQWAYDNNYYYGDGLSHECLVDMAELFELGARWTASEGEMIRALRDMRPVIAHMKNGFFSNSTGHYIVLTGEAEDGTIMVHDPGSRARSGKTYELEFILQETKGAEPFMIVG